MGAVEAAREDAMWHLFFKLETQMYLGNLLAAHKDLRLLLGYKQIVLVQRKLSYALFY